MFSFQIIVGSRRELIANSIHTADANATPTQLNSTVESRRRRRCVLGITYLTFGVTVGFGTLGTPGLI